MQKGDGVMDKKVSIIIPVCNGERFLARAVESAIAQTYDNIEILIIDDGSTDSSGEIADELAEKYDCIRVWHTPDRGVSAARNTGLENAGGDLITFLDADDALDEFLVENLVSLMEKTRADICGCMFSGVKDGKEETGQIHVTEGEKIISDCILNHDTRVWSKLFSRKAVEGVRFSEGLTIGEDMLFFLDCVRKDTVYAGIDKRLYLYTVNPRGAMEKPFAPSYMDQIRCWEMARARIEERFPDLWKQKDVRSGASAILAVSSLLAASKIAVLDSGTRKKFRK